MKVFELSPGAPEPRLVNEIASLLKGGGVIAYPTDTLYGLGGDGFNPDANHKIRLLKGREGAKPFPYVIDKPERLAEWGIGLTPAGVAIAEKFWPGPVSLIVEDSGNLPSDVLGVRRTICVRVPDNRIARAVAGALGGLLVATSANPAGRSPARNAREAMEYFRGEIDAVVDGGPSASGLPSTIVDVTGRKIVILREGAVPVDELKTVVAQVEKGPYSREGNRNDARGGV
ncbi:MAG: threonylcarbamoyl-AMP synthase [Candidatus Hydrogenedentota bacterium]|nr:MAG: threonylcarbamoyl-AMP synthase [Candidatus Hydrogenedentota bacterium]